MPTSTSPAPSASASCVDCGAAFQLQPGKSRFLCRACAKATYSALVESMQPPTWGMLRRFPMATCMEPTAVRCTCLASHLTDDEWASVGVTKPDCICAERGICGRPTDARSRTWCTSHFLARRSWSERLGSTARSKQKKWGGFRTRKLAAAQAEATAVSGERLTEWVELVPVEPRPAVRSIPFVSIGTKLRFTEHRPVDRTGARRILRRRGEAGSFRVELAPVFQPSDRDERAFQALASRFESAPSVDPTRNDNRGLVEREAGSEHTGICEDYREISSRFRDYRVDPNRVCRFTDLAQRAYLVADGQVDARTGRCVERAKRAPDLERDGRNLDADAQIVAAATRREELARKAAKVRLQKRTVHGSHWLAEVEAEIAFLSSQIKARRQALRSSPPLDNLTEDEEASQAHEERVAAFFAEAIGWSAPLHLPEFQAKLAAEGLAPFEPMEHRRLTPTTHARLYGQFGE